MTFAGIVKLAGLASLLTLAALGLSGCGRRGDLVSPTASTAAPSSGQTSASGGSAGGLTGSQSKTTTKAVAPKQGFVLDPLL